MDDLIARLNAATEGTAELDLAIAAALGHTGGAGWFSRSLDAAVTLVPAGIFWGAGSAETNYAWAGAEPFAEAATPALALCIAALMATENTK